MRILLHTTLQSRTINSLLTRPLTRSLTTAAFVPTTCAGTPRTARPRIAPLAASAPLALPARFGATPRASLHTTVTTFADDMDPPTRSQAVGAPLTRAATFLTLSVAKRPDAMDTVRDGLSSISDFSKNVVIRAPTCNFAVTVGIGSEVWDDLTKLPRPKELHPFKEIKGARHTAPSTPGDLLVHIRADRRDICFEFERQLLDALGDAVSVVDEVIGFRYFDARDLLGFVDGTANPVGEAIPKCTLNTADDDGNAIAGSYLVTQKYVHDLKGWNSLRTETQEAIIGRTKLDNVELPDKDENQQKPHKQLSTITDDQGVEHDILRDNMPFGTPGTGIFGTFFIGYSKRLWVTEKMLERMFIGVPAGLHDKILDYSTAKTGNVFFVPSADVISGLGD